MSRPSRKFLAEMDTLNRYPASQPVRVGRVGVHEGGQAIVGAL